MTASRNHASAAMATSPIAPRNGAFIDGCHDHCAAFNPSKFSSIGKKFRLQVTRNLRLGQI